MSARRCLPPMLIPGLLLLLAAAGTLPLGAQHSVSNCTSAANLIQELNRTNHIVFACNGTITLSNPIIITEDVTLDASDRVVTFSGNNLSRLFTIMPSGRLTLVNLILTGGRSVNGGAVHNVGQFIATNCVFAGNVAVGASGTNGTAGRDDSNDPTNGGNGVPGVAGTGGAIFNGGAAVLFECTFSTNSATGGNGGNGGKGGNAINGAFNVGDGGNGASGAPGRGGAILNTNFLSVIDCVFHRNTAIGGSGGNFGAAGTGGIPGQNGRGGAGLVGSGAAIHNTRLLLATGTTFSDNRAEGGDSGHNGEMNSGDGANGLVGGDAWGGAVCNLNTADLLNCTFSTNRVVAGNGGNGAPGEFTGGRGGNGGIGNGGNFLNSGLGFIVNCTFAGGAALGGTNGLGGAGGSPGAPGALGANRGGNLAVLGGTLELMNSLLCRPGTGANGYGPIADLGYNISSDTSIVLDSGNSRANLQPRIGHLADNDGFTSTFALLANSPAIDRGNPFDSPEVDQRGFPVFGYSRDIGAFEFAASSISVHVEDSEGNPLSGVQITVGTNNAPHLTGPGGNYIFPPMRAGDYLVVPSHPLYTFEPPSETVTLGGAVSLTFVGRRTFSLGGFVRDGTNGVNNVTVSIGEDTEVTGTNGFYEFTGLDAGTYTLVAEADGYAFVPGLQQIDLQGDTTNANFTAVGLHSISGRITDGGQGVMNVIVQAGNRSAMTGPSGDYTITELPERPQTVTPSRSGYSFNPPFLTVTPQGDENGIDFTAFASYGVSGVVLNSSNGLGANAVTLTLRTNAPQSGPPAPGGTTILLTDTNGLFAFTNLRAGTYVLTPSKPGHAFLPETNNVITVPPGASGVTYYMHPIFSMSGRVTAGSAGLSNVTVSVYTNGALIRELTNAANGNYVFTNFTAGTYELRPSLGGYDFTPTNRIVNLTNNAGSLDFTSSGLFAISGRIQSGTNGVANVVVRTTGVTDVTDANGDYTLPNLGPGTYTVTPESIIHGFQPVNAQVTLVNSGRTDVNFQVVSLFTINGEVKEGVFPLAGVQVTAGGVTNFTGPTGRYTLSRVPSGNDVLVTASLPGYQFAPPQQSIVLTNIAQGVNFSALGLSAISGRVIDIVTSNGLGGVQVSAGERYQVTTAANGDYVLTNVGPGLLTVLPLRTNRGFIPASQQVAVITNSVTTNVNFTSFRSFNLFGRVMVQDTTNGISGVTLRAVSNISTNTATTDPNGNYVFPALRNGSYVVTALLTGFGFEPRSPEVQLVANTRQDFEGFQGFSITGTIFEGANRVANLQVNVNTPGDTLTTLTDANGLYTFSGLAEGDYAVTPVGIGYDVTPGVRTVTLGPSTNGVNFNVQGNLAVSGRVLEGTSGLANMQVRITSTNLSPVTTRTAVTDGSGTFLFTNLPPAIFDVQPVQFQLFTPTNVIVNPFNYAPPTFHATGGRLSISRSNNVVKVILRALPGKLYMLQTAPGAAGPWTDLPPIRFADTTNGIVEYSQTNSPSPRLFRSRRQF